MKHPIGSVERFMEMINVIIKANGSMKLFREKHIDMSKAAPMIGTIMLGLQRQRIYHNPFRIYRLENFDEDWDLLIKETSFPGLREWGEDMSKDSFSFSFSLSFFSFYVFCYDCDHGSCSFSSSFSSVCVSVY